MIGLEGVNDHPSIGTCDAERAPLDGPVDSMPFSVSTILTFIRLRLDTLQLAAGMKGVVTRRSSQSEGGLGFGEFRFETPQLAAGSFIGHL